MWQMLRNRQIRNLKWRRQQVIDGFIADFYCSELNAVLEIDGLVHDDEEVKVNDEYRSSVFVKNEDCDKPHLIELIEHIITDNQTQT